MQTKLAVQNKLTRMDSLINKVIYHIKRNEGQAAIDGLSQLKEYSGDIQTLVNRENDK